MSENRENPYRSPPPDGSDVPLRGVVFNPASPVAARISQNMTRREKRASGVRFGLFGAWLGMSCAVPLSQALAQIHRGQLFGLTTAVCAILIISFLFSVPILLRRYSIFLCSTKYARQQGIRPQDL
ncbi:MAG: hypothetical protein RL215_3 [Planctomycetota bacterium]